MAQPGQTIRNGRLEITFRQTGSTTNGELLEMEATYGPGSTPPPSHFHPNQDEVFLVREGTLHFVVDGEPRDVGAGQKIEIPARAVHSAWNSTESPARATWQTRPALRSEEFFAANAILAGEHVTMTRFGRLLQRAVIASQFRAEFQLVPSHLNVVLRVLGVIGRLAGYKSQPAG